MKLYLAARFARANELDQIAVEALERGHTVTSRWHSGSHGDPAADVDITHPDMPRYAAEDIADLRAADTVVSFTAGGGGRGGRHVEFGMGLALGKRLVVVGPREHVFHTLDGVDRHDTFHEALDAIEAAAAIPAPGDQPPPVPNDATPVHSLICLWLGGHAPTALLDDLWERALVGRERYGTWLQVRNGRDPRWDGYQEALDGLAYAGQHVIETDGAPAARAVFEAQRAACEAWARLVHPEPADDDARASTTSGPHPRSPRPPRTPRAVDAP